LRATTKPVIQQDIADLRQLDRMLVSAGGSQTEAKKLLRRSPHGADRRAPSPSHSRRPGGPIDELRPYPVVEAHERCSFLMDAAGRTAHGRSSRSHRPSGQMDQLTCASAAKSRGAENEIIARSWGGQRCLRPRPIGRGCVNATRKRCLFSGKFVQSCKARTL